MSARNPYLDAAYWLASRGVRVIPLHSHDDAHSCTCPKGPTCPSPAKHPRVNSWRKAATTDLDRIAEWWGNWPTANVGAVCGDGTVVIDIDAAGWKPFGDFLKSNAIDLPETARVLTGSGDGAHYYFSTDEPVASYNIADGVEVRATGRYVVAPPSIHKTGRAYEWMDDVRVFAPLPKPFRSRPRPERSGDAPVAGKVGPGGRHDAMVTHAGALRRVGAGEREIYAALDVLNREGFDPPKDDAAVRAVAADIAKRYAPVLASNGAKPNSDRLTDVLASEIRDEVPRWLWDGWLPLGQLSLLAGLPGLGKTTFAIRLIAELSRGELPGEFFGTPCTSVVASLEDSISSTLIPRLKAAGADRDRVAFLKVGNSGDATSIDIARHLPDLQRIARKRDARFLFIDPLMAVLPQGVSSHRDQDVRSVLAPLADVAEDLSMSVLANMHFNKSAMDALLGVGGSIGFVAAARSVLVLGTDPGEERGDEGSARVIAHRKCNVGRRQRSRSVSIAAQMVTADDGSPFETSVALLGDEIDVDADDLVRPRGNGASALKTATDFLRDLLTDGPMTTNEVKRLAGQEGISQITLRRAREALGVDAYQDGRKWLMKLPEESE